MEATFESPKGSLKSMVARKPADQTVNRDDIIRAAAEVLHQNGYESTTMKNIAAQVNLTAASLYHHFRNKESLLLAVLEGGINRVTEQIEPFAMADDKSNADKLREMIHLHVVGVTEYTAVGAAMVFEMPAERLMVWLYATILTGAALVLLEAYSHGRWLYQGRGVAVLVKLLLLCLVPWLWGYRVPILVVVVVIASVGSHMPARFRYYSILHGRVVEGAKNSPR